MTALARSLSMNNPGWEQYTPVFSSTGGGATVGTGSVTGVWRREGDSVQVRQRVTFGAGGGGGVGNYQTTLPTGLTRSTDASKALAVGDEGVIGSAFTSDASGHATDRQCEVTCAQGSDQLQFIPTASTGAKMTAANPIVWTNGDILNVYATVPIEGW